MSVEENKALIKRYIEAFNGKAKTEAMLSEYVADEGLRRFISTFEAAFPRYELTLEDLIGEGDRVVARLVIRGTHRGEFRGAAPTGREVTFPAIIIYQIKGGKIAKHWLASDTLSLAQQVGLVPGSAGAAR
ncbi:MAG: ester cyclase [Gemmatimonadales bacterium]|nr:ester cyclase [Gemmatimonadales bacterium]